MKRSSTLKMEARVFSDTLLQIYQTIRRYILEDRHLVTSAPCTFFMVSGDYGKMEKQCKRTSFMTFYCGLKNRSVLSDYVCFV
jgi:hypothetical protein